MLPFRPGRQVDQHRGHREISEAGAYAGVPGGAEIKAAAVPPGHERAPRVITERISRGPVGQSQVAFGAQDPPGRDLKIVSGKDVSVERDAAEGRAGRTDSSASTKNCCFV